MIHPFQVLRLVIQEELAIEHPFPPILETAVELLRKVHPYYRYYRRNQIGHKANKTPLKGHPAIYGAALHLLHDYTQIGAYAVNLALITKCAEDLLFEYRQLDDHYHQLIESIHWKYPLYHPIQWKYEKGEEGQVGSSPLYFVLECHAMRLVQQIMHITSCALAVFKQLFKLSMCLCDAHLLFNNDPHMYHEACTDLVAKWDHYVNELKTNQNQLVQEIENRQALANRLLKHLGIDHKSISFIAQLNDKIKKWMKDNEALLTDIYHVAEETLDTIYVKGKITPLHIDLTAVHAAKPKIPYSRFAPWAGQAVVIINDSSPVQSPFKNIEKFILNFANKFPEMHWKK